MLQITLGSEPHGGVGGWFIGSHGNCPAIISYSTQLPESLEIPSFLLPLPLLPADGGKVTASSPGETVPEKKR